MRIRKNAKISQLSSSSTPPSSSTSNPFLLKTHHLQCQLNQSPWDVITFPIPPQDDSSSPHFQFQEDEDFGFAGNGSFGDDSIEATHSTSGSKEAVIIGSEEILMMNNDRKWNSCEVDREDRETSQVGFNVNEGAKGNVEDDVMLCCETNRKGWQCGRELKKGHKVCARHLRYVTIVGDKNSASNIMTSATRRGRGRPPKKKKVEPVDQNPYEFYYYSGFGPLWGKKKGLMIKRTADNVTTGIDDHESKHEDAKRIEDKEIDYMECDDSEEEEIGKKRGRKRIKARSLKSLM